MFREGMGHLKPQERFRATQVSAKTEDSDISQILVMLTRTAQLSETKSSLCMKQPNGAMIATMGKSLREVRKSLLQ